MGLSFWHILVLVVVVLIVFGAGRIPQIMGDLGKGIKSFKAGLEDGNKKPDQQAQITDKSDRLS